MPPAGLTSSASWLSTLVLSPYCTGEILEAGLFSVYIGRVLNLLTSFYLIDFLAWRREKRIWNLTVYSIQS